MSPCLDIHYIYTTPHPTRALRYKGDNNVYSVPVEPVFHGMSYLYIYIYIYKCDIPWNTGSAGTLYTLLSPLVPQGPSRM